jgi:hypothetical protein
MTAARVATAPASPKASASRLVLWLVIGVGLALVALVAGGPKAPGRSLDPNSTSATGTKAMRLLLEDSGALVDVTDTAPGASTDVAVLLVDTTSSAMTDELQRWVEHGGVLVVADSRSSFTPATGGSTQVFGGVNASLPRGNCRIDVLQQVDRVAPPGAGVRYALPDGAAGCFTDEAGSAFVVDTPTGLGHIVSIGSAGVFTNEALAGFDNAVLAVDLMAPRPGTRVSVLWGMQADAGTTHEHVRDLISTGVRLAFLQIFVAFLIYAWWRGRRLGSPVLELQPVQIGGSELVAAVGNLLQQTRDPDRAARLLRADLRRRLCERLGLAPGAAPDIIADVTSTRSGVDRDRIARAVTDLPVRTEDDLLDLARDIDTIRTEVLHGTAP